MREIAVLTCVLCGHESAVVQPEELEEASIGRGGARMVQHLVHEHGMDDRTAEFAVRDVLGYTTPARPSPRCGGQGETTETIMLAHPVWLDGRPVGLSLHQEIVWRTCWECGGSGEAKTA